MLAVFLKEIVFYGNFELYHMENVAFNDFLCVVFLFLFKTRDVRTC